MIPDDLWAKISPKPHIEGAGLLCPACIGRKIEEISDYAAFQLIEIP